MSFIFFFFNDTATTEIYTLSLHDALPIYYLQPSLTPQACPSGRRLFPMTTSGSQQQLIAAPLCTLRRNSRSEEHTSELQSQSNLVCRLLLEKKKKKHIRYTFL